MDKQKEKIDLEREKIEATKLEAHVAMMRDAMARIKEDVKILTVDHVSVGEGLVCAHPTTHVE